MKHYDVHLHPTDFKHLFVKHKNQKTMKKYLFILSCLFLVPSGLFAQDRASAGFTASDKFSLNAQRPTVNKIVGSTVDYYTGTANIRVGLHTISSHGFTIPLA